MEIELARLSPSTEQSHRQPAHGARAIVRRLAYRRPLDAEGLIRFFALRAVPGVEEVLDRTYRRSLRLPRGTGVIELEPVDDHIQARFVLEDARDLATAVERCRWLLDLDADPQAVDDVLARDPLLEPLVRAAPGRRVPGHVDPAELAIRAVLGQQVSLAAASTLAKRIVADCGARLAQPVGGVDRLFPSPQGLLELDPAQLRMPHARRRALRGLAGALASGELELNRGTDPEQARLQLLRLPGIGPWTWEYIAMRALGDHDAFPAADVGVRRALQSLGQDGRPRAATALAERWRPHRAYAVQHLWAHLTAAGQPQRPADPGRSSSSEPLSG